MPHKYDISSLFKYILVVIKPASPNDLDISTDSRYTLTFTHILIQSHSLYVIPNTSIPLQNSTDCDSKKP